MPWYHGTPHANRLQREGVRLDDLPPDQRKRDPGDFGWGFYATTDRSRAKAHGTVFLVGLDPDALLATISDPYGMRPLQAGASLYEHLYRALAFDGERQIMRTVNGTPRARTGAAQAIRRAFLDLGVAGLVTDHAGGELVVFASAIVRSLSEVAA
jgi:hypothetical protein